MITAQAACQPTVVWTTSGSGDSIYRGTASSGGTITFGTPITLASKAAPQGIDLGADGNLWVAGPGTNSIYRVTTAGVVTAYTTGITASSQLQDVAAGPDGRIWVTVPTSSAGGKAATNRVIAIATGSGPAGGTAGTVTEYSTGITAASAPYGITAGPDGRMWFTENQGNRIGAIATGYNAAGTSNGTTAGTVTEYSTGITAGSQPREITKAADGNLWFTEYAGNRVAKITTSGTVTEYSTVTATTPAAGGTAISTAISQPDAITQGPDGIAWFATNANNTWYSVTSGGTINVYSTGVTGASNYSGLSFYAPDGNLWGTNASQSTVVRMTPGPPSAPTVTRTSPTATPTNSSSQTFSFTGVDGASFTCSLDNVTYSACTSPYTINTTGLNLNGSNTLYVKQTAGSAGTSVAGTTTWTIDTTAPSAPTVTRTAPASSPTNSTTASITYSGEANATFTCSTDNVTYSACAASPVSLTGLTEGAKTYYVKQTDQAGNTSTASSVSWTVDLTAPTVSSFTTSQSSPTNASSFTYSLSFSESVTGLATGDFTVGGTGSGWTVTGVSGSGSGPYTVTVTRSGGTDGTVTLALGTNTVTDTAGNTGPTSTSTATPTITSDQTAPSAPTVTRTAPASSPTNSTTASITYSGDVGSTFTCSTDNVTYSACAASPVSLSGLTDGTKNYYVKQTDAAGNTSTAGSVTWTIDTTAPTVSSFTTSQSSPTNTSSFTYSLSFSESVTGLATGDFTVGGTGTGWTVTGVSGSGSGPYTVTVTRSGGTDGTVTLRLDTNTVTDTAGNTGPASTSTATPTITSDQTAPDAPSLTSTPPSTSILHTGSFTWTGESGATFTCSFDGTSYSSCTSPYNYNRPHGSQTLYVKATDSAGNTSSAASYSWTITPNIVNGPPGLSDRNGNALSLSVGVDYNGGAASYIKARGWTTVGEQGAVTREVDWERCTTTNATSCSDILTSGGVVYRGWDYQPKRADVGRYLRACVYVTTSENVVDSGCSSMTPVIMHTNFTPPSISLLGQSAPTKGKILVAGLGFWHGYNPGSTFGYQWQRCTSAAVGSCSNISSATGVGYTPVTADVGNRLRLALTLTQIVSGVSLPVTAYSPISATVR